MKGQTVFSRFCLGPKCYVVQYIVSGEENRPYWVIPWDYVIRPEDDQATAIANMHKN